MLLFAAFLSMQPKQPINKVFLARMLALLFFGRWRLGDCQWT